MEDDLQRNEFEQSSATVGERNPHVKPMPGSTFCKNAENERISNATSANSENALLRIGIVKQEVLDESDGVSSKAEEDDAQTQAEVTSSAMPKSDSFATSSGVSSRQRLSTAYDATGADPAFVKIEPVECEEVDTSGFTSNSLMDGLAVALGLPSARAEIYHTDHERLGALLHPKKKVKGSAQTGFEKGDEDSMQMPSSSVSQDGPGEDGSGSASGPPTQKRKRARTNFVWNLVCETEHGFECSICGKLIRSASATNITTHMSRKHPRQLANARAADERSKSRQKMVPFANASVTSSTIDENRQRKLTRLLTLAIATSDAPISFVENAFLKQLCSYIDDFKLPNSIALENSLRDECEIVNKRIKLTLSRIDALAVSLGIWANKSMDHSLLNITVQFCDPEKGKLVRCFLDCIDLKRDYTIEYLRESIEQVLQVYGIGDKVSRFVGDNGANVRPALKEPFSYSLGEQHINDEASPLDLESLSWQKIAEIVVAPTMEAEEDEDGPSRESVAEQRDAGMRFAMLFNSSYIPCAVHSLSLVLKQCFDMSDFMQRLRQCIFEVLSRFYTSALLTKELLVETGGKKPIFPGDRNWLTIFVTYRRVLQISTALNVVCARHNINTLSPAVLDHTNEVVRLLQKFQDVTAVLQAKNRPTISHVLPAVLELQEHLKTCENTMSLEVRQVAASIREGLQIRFAAVLQSGENDSDPIYILSTFFDRTTAFLLPKDRRRNAMELAKKMIRRMNTNSGEAVAPEDEETFVASTFDPLYSSLANRAIADRREEARAQERNCPGIAEVQKYEKDVAGSPVQREAFNAIQFWCSQRYRFPTLYALALKYLCVPAGSADLDRCFSHVTTHKLRMSPELLRAKVTLTFNQNLLRGEFSR